MTQMSEQERTLMIDRLKRSFDNMPRWVQVATLHATATTTESTGNFEDVLTSMSDDSLKTLYDDVEDNGDLVL